MDFKALRQSLAGRCFICEMLSGNPEFSHHVVYEDEQAVAFLNRYPVLYGYVLVAPKEHREAVTRDFSRDEYLALQEVVHGVGEALRRAVPTERLYVLSLGSQEGNRHVHWHLAPLPPGVPYARQQLAALNRNVCLDLNEQETADLAARIRAAITESAQVPTLGDGVVTLDGHVLGDIEAHLAGEDDEQARRFGWYPQRSTAEGVRSAMLRWKRDWTLNGPTRAFAMREASSRELVGGCQIRLRESGWRNSPTGRLRRLGGRATRPAQRSSRATSRLRASASSGSRRTSSRTMPRLAAYSRSRASAKKALRERGS